MNPDISLIFCSRYSRLSENLIDNIAKTIGCSYELIAVDNSKGKYSISEAYQVGFERSNGEFLVFLHDDIAFHTYSWGALLKEHLSEPGTGICGIGGRDTIVRIPSSWKVSLPYIHLTQSDKTGQSRRIKHRPAGFTGTKFPVIMLDGVFLSMHRTLLDHFSFDIGLKGFHAYDFDSCIRSASAGFQNYVIYNIDIEHFSKGSPDKSYYQSLIQVFRNHREHLPLSVKTLNPAQLRKLEKSGLNRLIRKMLVKGFDTDEIMQVYIEFSELISKSQKKSMYFRCKRRYLQTIITFIRLLIQKLNKK